jgi:PAS domain S-box-containing protein
MSAPGKRILIVEDQRLIAADIENTLKKLGYSVVASVATGEDAVEKATEVRPDLALMDIRLRGAMDGIQAAEAIRARTDIPIIYLTAYADEETILRARGTAPFGYLVKPFNERELRAAIEIAIAKHETDRLLAEERSRRRAAEEFKLLVECVEDYAIYMLDPSGHVASWNEGAKRITGYTVEETLGKHFSLFYPQEEMVAGELNRVLEAALRDGRTACETWRVRKDGSRFWASVVTTAIRDDSGQLRGFGKIMRDLTVRQRDELALKESATRTSAMIDAALDCIISMDASGRIVEFNPAAERTFGHTRKEAIGQEMASLIIPVRLRDEHRAGLAAHLQTGEGPILGKRIEMPAMRKDGSEIAVELSVVRLPGSEPPMFTGFLRDITAQKQAESEKKHQEAFERLLDRASVALASSLDISQTTAKAARLAIPDLADWCLVDLATEAGELSQAAAAHVDPDREALARRLGREVIPESEHGSHQVFRSGKPELHPALDDLAWAGDLLGTEYPGRLRELGVISYLSVPIEFREQTQGVLNLLRSAPARRYLSKDLAVAQELARRIGIAIDNARLFREAQEAIQARDEFLQIASHELKTPLTPLQIQLDALLRLFEKSGMQNERIRSKLDAAIRQTARLGRLVERLLDVSRITSGKFELETEKCDLATLVREVADRFHGEAKNAGSDIKVIAEDGVFGWWDHLRLEQIVSNLVSNAIKYGLGRPIVVEARTSDDTVRVAVTDRGIGIEKESLGRIFGRFERGVSLRHYGGLGLGLFIARRFAVAHGGTIVAQSQPGQGSTFTLVLPRGNEASASPFYAEPAV